ALERNDGVPLLHGLPPADDPLLVDTENVVRNADMVGIPILLDSPDLLSDKVRIAQAIVATEHRPAAPRASAWATARRYEMQGGEAVMLLPGMLVFAQVDQVARRLRQFVHVAHQRARGRLRNLSFFVEIRQAFDRAERSLRLAGQMAQQFHNRVLAF